MKFSKPSPGLIDEFKAATADIPGAQPRKMFGYDCIFVGGNYAAGLWQNTCVFKLSDEDGARFTAQSGAVPFAPMQGRVMKSWYEAPEAVAHDAEQLAEWCQRAAAFARSLPPKVKSAGKAKAAGATAKAAKVAAKLKPAASKTTKAPASRARPPARSAR